MGQQAGLQTVSLGPCVSTLQPVTFCFRSVTHLTILPCHAFMQLLLAPGTEAPNRCHLPTHSPHPVCCVLPTDWFPHTRTDHLPVFHPMPGTPLFYNLPPHLLPRRTPQRVQKQGYHGAQGPAKAIRQMPALDLPLLSRPMQRSTVS